jgi:hypothetical protein
MKFVHFVAALTFASGASASNGPLPPLTAETKPLYADLLSEALADKYISQQQFNESMYWLDHKPCEGIDRSMPPKLRRKLEDVVAAHLKVKPVRIFASIASSGWYVVFTQASEGNQPVVFFEGEPKKTKAPVAVWHGPAPIFKVAEVARWAKDSAKGIPNHLAECFAWSAVFPQR